jgi:hypothetical protein
MEKKKKSKASPGGEFLSDVKELRSPGEAAHRRRCRHAGLGLVHDRNDLLAVRGV